MRRRCFDRVKKTMADKLGQCLYAHGAVYSRVNVGDEELLYKARLRKPKTRELTQQEQASMVKPDDKKDDGSNSVQAPTEATPPADLDYDEYHVKLKFVRSLSTGDEEGRSVVKMCVDNFMTDQKMLQLRRSYYS